LLSNWCYYTIISEQIPIDALDNPIFCSRTHLSSVYIAQTIAKNGFNRYFVRPPKKSRFVSNGKRGLKRKYDVPDRKIIEEIRGIVGNICAEKIHPMVGVYVGQLKLNKKP